MTLKAPAKTGDAWRARGQCGTRWEGAEERLGEMPLPSRHEYPEIPL